jgi:hypothetical protein
MKVNAEKKRTAKPKQGSVHCITKTLICRNAPHALQYGHEDGNIL